MYVYVPKREVVDSNLRISHCKNIKNILRAYRSFLLYPVKVETL